MAVAPRLVARAKEPGANIGRCRVIELQPNTYAEALYNMHRDDNNRLNPEGTGWIVRAFFNLTDNPDSLMILREDKDDPATEIRIPLPAGAQVVIDTQRLWHAVLAPGRRAALLPHHVVHLRARSSTRTSRRRHPVPRIDVPPLDPAVRGRGRGRGAAACATTEPPPSPPRGADPTFGDGSLSGGYATEVLSEA